MQPDAWLNVPLFELRYPQLKESLKIDPDKKYYTFNEIANNDRFPVVMRELRDQVERKIKLDPYFQAVQRLENQIFTFREIASGRMLRMVPPKQGTAWIAAPEFPEALRAKFGEMTKAFLDGLVAGDNDGAALATAQANLSQAVSEFVALAKAENPELYASETEIKTEVFYNQFHPFKWAWIFYVLAAVFMSLVWILNKQTLYKLSWAFAILGLGMHLYGFGIRVFLMGRPPVTNMYETVVWVAFGSIVFSMIMEAVYRWRFILLAGSAVASLCLVIADMAPVVLDPSLQPLEPVLRSNYWLLIHVLTITISYAAFFLAFALGDIGLILYLKGEKENLTKIKAIALAIYRSIQIGVALLGPGIILGGIWADYSWGRFWGWDPKETWALIVFLGYLAVLHGRLVGYVKDFGMICSAVVAFSLVIMAWYGVNFILGAGLHSYGFGAGGVEYVSVFIALHIMLVVFTAVVRFGRLKNPA
jgi:cytochrome c-type biogenesis protein CcsB